MTFTPDLPSTFCNVDDPDLKIFLERICDKKKLASFIKRVKAASKAQHWRHTFQERHYFELVIIIVLGRKEGLALLNLLDKQVKTDSLFECLEYLTTLKDVYRQMPGEYRPALKGCFNRGFDSLMGMIPLAQEMSVARALYNTGFAVEFAEYSGAANYDFRASANDVTIEIDCKVFGGDNGKFFKLSASGQVFQRVAKTMERNRDFFDNNILCVSIDDQNNSPSDLPLTAKQAVDGLLKGGSIAQANGITAELFPLDTEVADLIKMADSRAATPEIIKGAIKGYRNDWNSNVEWMFTSRFGPYDMRFALVLCSPNPPPLDWEKSLIRVVKKSLNGQLKNCECPVIFVRFNDLSDKEIFAGWFTETKFVEGGGINPLDKVFHEIVSDSSGKKLCAMFFQHRTQYQETQILGPTGNSNTIGRYNIRSFYNDAHPTSGKLRQVIRWHN